MVAKIGAISLWSTSAKQVFALGSNTTNSQGATLVITTGTACPAGSLIVVAYECGSNSAGTSGAITDSAGNTYTSIDTCAMGNPTAGAGLVYAKNATLSAGGTITLTITGPVGTYGAMVAALGIIGASTSAPLDVHAVGTGTISPYTSGNVTTTVASEVLVGFLTGYTASAFTEATNFTSASGTLNHTGSNSQVGNLGYRKVSATGTYAYTPSTASNLGQDGCFIATFK